ncbi:MAG: (Fe-S)-binding protein, partial [Desulfobacula sp.]
MLKTYPQRPDRIYFFGTCLVDAIYPEAGIAAIRLIQKHGVKVVFPPDQSCCGQPAYNSGFPDEARGVA